LALSIFTLQFSIYERAKGMPTENSFYNPIPSPKDFVPSLHNFPKNKGEKYPVIPLGIEKEE
jgi:hypothetical protein